MMKWDKGTIQEHRVVSTRRKCVKVTEARSARNLTQAALSKKKAYGPELKEAISSVLPIRHFRNHDQNMRSKTSIYLMAHGAVIETFPVASRYRYTQYPRPEAFTMTSFFSCMRSPL